MAIMDGCESRHITPIPEERVCPVCGETIEVFTRKGRIIEDAECSCGYVIRAEEQIVPQARKPQ